MFFEAPKVFREGAQHSIILMACKLWPAHSSEYILQLNNNDMVGGDMARVTSLGNGPMDSVQVGKAVFVKEKLHNPGNRTQDLLLSGENR